MTDDARDDEDEEKAQTPEELRATLDEYRASLAEVTEGLRETPEDEELLDLRASLVEVIEITEDVLASTVEASSAREEEEEKDTVDGRAPTGASGRGEDVGGKETRTEATPSSLAATFVGKDVLTLDADGAWRPGRCVRVMDDGCLDVYLTETHARVAVKAGDVRRDFDASARLAKAKAAKARNATANENENENAGPREVYRGLPEPKRFELTRKTEYVRKEPPKNLEIKPGDDAETRETKRKKLKMFKYKQRQQEIAAEQNQKASSWQSFQATGLKKKKRGMQTNSIFSSKT